MISYKEVRIKYYNYVFCRNYPSCKMHLSLKVSTS